MRKAPCLKPDLEKRQEMAAKDTRHLAELVNLSRAARSQAMIDRQFVDGEAVTMKTSDKLPPKSLLHRTNFPDQHGNHFLARENV